MVRIKFMNTSIAIALRIPHNTFDDNDKSPLIQGMAWSHPPTTPYLTPRWSRFMSPYGVTRQCVLSILPTEKLIIFSSNILSNSCIRIRFRPDDDTIQDGRWDFVTSHYNDVIMGTIASQITSLTIVYSTFDSDADQRKHQSSVSLAFVRGIHRGPVNFPHKWRVTRKMFPFDDVITSRHMAC